LTTAYAQFRSHRLEGRIPELDGIRGLAILLVLVWHYVANLIKPGADSWQFYALAPLRLTWSGVDLFFVLSGFLIGGILLDARDSPTYYRTFYLRRIHRIFPLYFLWLLLFLAGLYWARSDGYLFNEDVPVWSYSLFLQNFFMASRDTFGAQWLAITWSLAIEEQFYFLLPWLVRRLSVRRLSWLVVASIVFAPLFRFALWRSYNEPLSAFVLFPSRMDGLALGVLVAIACRSEQAWRWLTVHRRECNIVLILLGCGMVLLHAYPRQVQPFGFSWIVLFYALLLLRIVMNPGPIAKGVFGGRLLRWLGTVSFAIYVFHQGINDLFLYLALGQTQPRISDWASLGVTMLSLVVVIALAGLSWHFFERRLIRRAHVNYRYEPPISREAAA
jgi:peptidoglycan/LPS O-acetylase OafA/YrhL